MEIPAFSNLTVEDLVGQMFIVGIHGTTFEGDAARLISEIKPGGICLFSRNIREADQTRKLIDDCTAAMAIPPILALDQEGGLVDRLRRVIAPMPAPATFRSADDAGEFGSLVGQIVSTLGFNVNFAPVVDVIDKERAKFTNGLHSRVFGSSVNEVIDLAGAFLRNMQAEGVIGCLKHFPGLGAAEVDSHEELPLVNIETNRLNEIDLAPYRALIDEGAVKSVMIAHAAFPRWDLQEKDQNGRLLPSSLSASAVSLLLRNQIGFNGLVISDDLEMGAIVNNYGIGEACVMAVEAGVDMLAVCANEIAIRDGHQAVLSAVKSGRISMGRLNESASRIHNFKTFLPKPEPFDLEKLSSLSNKIAELKVRIES